MKTLPIGISTLRFLIEDQMVYVDKTGIIAPLVHQKGRYFLSRPRRFGKSLLVDTFKQLFSGNEALFRGLAIHESWDWSVQYPVIKIDWVAGMLQTRAELDRRAAYLLNQNARELGVPESEGLDLPEQFERLIEAAAERFNRPVVVLVDEYDKPLLDNIENRDRAAEMRDGLKNLYSALKKADDLLQFVFLTGVSKFSKVSIFSGINNLDDITLDANYATICGYTDADLDAHFSAHLTGVDRAELRHWYNGYSFLGEPVYNPFDILLFISKNHSYRNYWFETGTPTYLVRLLQQERYFLPDLEHIAVSDEQIGSFEVDQIAPEVLLLQTGYLTIDRVEQRMGEQWYQLRIPNAEVRQALAGTFFRGYSGIVSGATEVRSGAYEALRAHDMPALERAIRRLCAGIAWRNFTNNDIAEYEGYWASVLYAYFVSLTAQVIPEDTSNHGQADLTVILNNTVCIMEIKVADAEHAAHPASNAALQQIQERGYAAKYLGVPDRRVFEVGMIFSRPQRTLVQFDYAEPGTGTNRPPTALTV